MRFQILNINLNFEHLSSTEKIYFELTNSVELRRRKKKKFKNNLILLKSTNNSLFLKFLQLHYKKKETLKIKKEKLKLGLVSFEIKEITFDNYFISDSVEMIFSRQDNTQTNLLKIENQLTALDWKWNFDNICALLIIAFFSFHYFYNFLYDYLQLEILLNLKDFEFDQDSLIQSIKNLLSIRFSFLRNIYFMNKNFNDNLLDLFFFFY